MQLIKQLKAWFVQDSSQDIKISQGYRLINIITIELILVSVLFTYVNAIMQLWAMFYLVIIANCCAILNLAILRKTNNVVLSGHILTSLVLIVTILANWWMGGLSSSYFIWFYVIPILAAVIIGIRGLILYAVLSLGTSVIIMMIATAPLYILSDAHNLIIDLTNRFFSLFVIVSTLYFLIRKNNQYEKILQDNNYLLQADKDKFHYMARYDTLTNLPNRAYFQTYSQNVIDSAKKTTHCVTVFFMDLDGFKKINDHYGHDAGDALLLQAGKRLKYCFREADFLARLGGDEFIAIINHTKEDNAAQRIAERILAEFNKPFMLINQEVICKISIGLASHPLHSTTIEKLINDADQAMYSAKRAGGNTYCWGYEIKNTQK